MTVAVYTLRIRETADDADGTEVRIVAASLTEAVARAEMRFGPGRIVSIEQAETPPTDEEAAAAARGDDADSEVDPVPATPIIADDFIVAQAPETLGEPRADEPVAMHDPLRDAEAALAYVHPAATDSPRPPLPAHVEDAGDDPAAALTFETVDDDTPAALEGRWRPTVLLWGGAIAGLVAFTLWLNFGTHPRERFITAHADAPLAQSGLAIEGEAPAGGVLQATGVSLRPGRADDDIGAMVGQGVTNLPGEESGSGEITYEGDVDDDTVETIGTVVGEIFSRWPDDAPAPPPPQEPQPAWPREQARAPLPEPALLQRWYIEVQRADRVTETLSVNATSAEHARAMVYDRPDHPVIVNGPSTELTW